MTLTFRRQSRLLELHLHRTFAIHWLNEAGTATLHIGPLLVTYVYGR